MSTRDRFSKQVSRGARLQRSKMNDDGSYSFRYETGDGMSREERGRPQGQGVTGSWSYTGADGKQYQVRGVLRRMSLNSPLCVLVPDEVCRGSVRVPARLLAPAHRAQDGGQAGGDAGQAGQAGAGQATQAVR